MELVTEESFAEFDIPEVDLRKLLSVDAAIFYAQ